MTNSNSINMNEVARIRSLESYEILDSPAEEAFDDIARLCASLCEAPYVLISFVDSDRQWFKSHIGMRQTETPRDISFSQHAIKQRDVLVVQDATEDPRFASSPLAAGELGIRFYAGAPLITPDGHAIGTLCVMDTAKRCFTQTQEEALKTLAQQVVAQLELRKSKYTLERTEDELDRVSQECQTAANAINANIGFLETVMSSLEEGICTLDKDGNVTFINRSAQIILGWSYNDLRGKRFHDVVHLQCTDDTSTNSSELTLRSVLDTGAILRNFEDEYLRQDGSVFPVLCSASPIVAAGTITGLVLAFRDDTERRVAEHERQIRETELQTLADNVSALLFRVDSNERIMYWNQRFQTAMGEDILIRERTLEEILGQETYVTIRPYVQTALTGLTMHFEALMPSRDQGLRNMHSTFTPEFDLDGKVTGFIIAAVDITERLRLEAQLSQAQKLESIGQLAAGIAHELNTPIQYIGHNARFLRDSFTDIERVLKVYERLAVAAHEGSITRELLQTLDNVVKDADVSYLIDEIPAAINQSLEGTERVAEIVGAMKEFSHPGTSQKTMVDLNKIIQSTAIVSKHDWKYVAELTMNLDRDLPSVCCLPGELNQVFLNIIINAAHAIEDTSGESAAKGSITVTTSQVKHADKSWAQVQISDSGSGIRPEILPRIFDPFFTTKGIGKGTGQGLAIARNIVVEKHNGTITCETETGVGTTFTIRLPLTENGV